MRNNINKELLKHQFIVEDNHIECDYLVVEKDEKIFIFTLFFDKFTNKSDVLFKELLGGKMNLENILIINDIMKDIREIIDDYERV